MDTNESEFEFTPRMVLVGLTRKTDTDWVYAYDAWTAPLAA